MDESEAAATMITTMLDGRLRLRQPATGHRAGTDAVLLAASAPVRAGMCAVDVGAGIGTVGLMLALREPTATVDLIEIVPDLATLARDNAALNGVGDRVLIHAVDVLDTRTHGGLARRAELAVSNPPFYQAGQHRASPDALRARAHTLPDGEDATSSGHGGWLRAMLALLVPHGMAILIHRPDALPALLQAAEGRMGGVAVRPVHARAGRDAIRVIVGGVVGSRAPLRFAEPLLLHGDDGGFTPLVEALHRGQAHLPLFAAAKSRPVGPAS